MKVAGWSLVSGTGRLWRVDLRHVQASSRTQDAREIYLVILINRSLWSSFDIVALALSHDVAFFIRRDRESFAERRLWHAGHCSRSCWRLGSPAATSSFCYGAGLQSAFRFPLQFGHTGRSYASLSAGFAQAFVFHCIGIDGRV